MPPRLVDVDAAKAEGTTVYKIGGLYWVAPEPDIETTRRIANEEIMAAARVLQEVRTSLAQVEAAQAAGEANGGAASAADADAASAADKALQATEDDLIDRTLEGAGAIGAVLPKLQQLLFAGNTEGQYLACTYRKPRKGATGPARAGTCTLGEVVDETRRVAIPTEFAEYHMSTRRAAAILEELLGEG